MSVFEQGMELYLKRMSKEQKKEMMGTMMPKFLAGMAVEERKEMMATTMPGMMAQMFDGMTKEEKNEIMGSMMRQFLSGMSKEEKLEMMATTMPGMMDSMFEGMTPADMRGMMPRMMSGMMAKMMPGMMGGNTAAGSSQGSAVQDGSAPVRVAPGRMRELFMSTVSEEKDATVRDEMPGCSCCEEMRPWECCPCRETCAEVFRAMPAR